VLICLATFFSSGAQFLVLTAIPSLLTELGFSSGFVGAFVGAFGLGALLVRLPVGRAVDRLGSRFFALLGAGSMCSAYLLYAILSTAITRPSFAVVVPFLLPLAGLAHSLGFSTYGTAAHSFVAYTVPKNRRGEAISYYGIVIDAARALSAGLSLVIVARSSFSTVFVLGAISALLATALASNLSRTKRSAGENGAVPKLSRIERRVLAPALTNSTLALSAGASLAFIPLLGLERGIVNPGIFFTVNSMTSILMRVFAGRLIDRIGRVASIIPGMLLAAAGLLVISGMSTMAALVAAGLVYGTGFSVASIALQARAIDLGGPERQGAAMATYFAMVDLGIGLGSITAGQFVPILGYGGVFSLASVLPVIGLTAFLIHTRFHHTGAGPSTPADIRRETPQLEVGLDEESGIALCSDNVEPGSKNGEQPALEPGAEDAVSFAKESGSPPAAYLSGIPTGNLWAVTGATIGGMSH